MATEKPLTNFAGEENPDIVEESGAPMASNSYGSIERGSASQTDPERISVNGERTPLIRLGSDERSRVPDEPRRRSDQANLRWTLSREDSVEYNNPPSSIRTLGTFAGVFCPVSNALYCTIFFLRIGFLLGHGGLIHILVQFGLAYLIIIMTALSICAISTNGAVEGGGAYFMISRALGPEFGGSIGLLFFLAQVCGCAMSISGFVEALVDNFGVGGMLVGDGGAGMPVSSPWWNYLYCSMVLGVCLIVCLIGGKIFGKTNIFTLLITVVCGLTVFISTFVKGPQCVEYASSNKNHTILNLTGTVYANLTCNWNTSGLYTGFSRETFSKNLQPNYTIDYLTEKQMSFASVFAVLFSSITGIMNGANMSGDLKDPSKAIPKGTLSAAVVSLVIYIILSFVCSATADRSILIGNYNYIQAVNVWPPFVVIGVFATMLSAAMANLIGGSRILHALAKDEIFWFFLKPATITTPNGNPIVAVAMAWFLVQLVLLVGSLNAIAPMCSELFLLGYASTNLACLALDLTSAPNFRPMFKYFSSHTALIGMFGSIAMCFLVNPIYASIAISILIALVLLLHLRGFQTSWGSISQALLFHQVRKYLLLLDSRKDHIKFWRPQMLLLVSNPRGSCQLIDFVNDLKKSGLFVVGHVKVGSLDEEGSDPLAQEMPRWLRLIDQLKVKAFVELTLSGSGVRSGVEHLMRLSGLGGMKPNTICFGFYDSSELISNSFEQLQQTKRSLRGKKLFRRLKVRREAGKSAEVLGIDEASSECVEEETGRDNTVLEGFPAVMTERKHRVSTNDYVHMISDALKIGKNVCILRNFYQLDKAVIASAGSRLKGRASRMCIDVWPIDFFRPDKKSARRFDNTSLFVLQLACILHMSADWKSRTVVRVFTCIEAGGGADEATSDGDTDSIVSDAVTEETEDENRTSTTPRARSSSYKDSKMAQYLRDLRIRGQIRAVAWDSALARLRDVTRGSDATPPGSPRTDLPPDYLNAVNNLIRSESSNTAVVFLYLPSPPGAESGGVEVSPRPTSEQMDNYLSQLNLLTNNLPPTVMVRGVQPVTSTAL